MMTGLTRIVLTKGFWIMALAAMLALSGCGGGSDGGGTDSYAIELSAAPTEGGIVGGGGSFEAGTEVTVSAVANTGYHFVNWTEGGSEVSTEASHTFSATARRALVANFALNSYSVSTNAGDGGSISPGDATVEHGEVTSFTVIPNTEYAIESVNGCGAGSFDSATSRYTTGAVTGDCTVNATFTPSGIVGGIALYTIDVNATPIAGGTVQGSGAYSGGTAVTLNANPSTGYSFLNWTEGGTQVSTDTAYTFSATADRTLTANFRLNRYTVSTNPGNGGSVSPTSQSVDHGGTASLTITPDAGFSIESVSGCGGSLNGNTYTTGAVTEKCTVSANFTLNSYTVSTTAGTGGSISPGSATVSDGGSTSFTATPDTGYSIASVTGCDGALNGNTFTTGQITGACTVNASFAVNSYTIGGTVSGLIGTGLVLQNNSGDDLPLTSDGDFAFTSPVDHGRSFSVSVLTQPTGPSQTCTVTNESGTVDGADVTNVAVSCTTNTYTLGGTVSGLTGTGLVLHNNAGDDLPIITDGNFNFATAIEDGGLFEITVLTQPTGQFCSVENGSGTVSSEDVTSVQVVCSATTTYTIGGVMDGLASEKSMTLQLNGGNEISLDYTANGLSYSFSIEVADGDAYEVTIPEQPKQHFCTVSNSTGIISGGSVTNVDVNCIYYPIVATGHNHTVAIKADGTLWAWGKNDYGQLGTGDTKDVLVPTKIGADSNWSAVSVGYYHTLAMKSDGTLWAFGGNMYGQLGVGNNTNSSSPVQIASNTAWAGVSSGNYHSVGLKADGSLWTWGFNSSGQLGINSTSNANSPELVSSATAWSTIAAGGSHTLAIKSDGTLWAWGKNTDGQLGTGNTDNSLVPVAVGSVQWSGLAAGDAHSVALDAEGHLWSWGDNEFGQLGIGSNIDSNTPAPVGSPSDTWETIGAGFFHTLAIKSDDTLWGWGRNGNGQLGLGHTDDSYIPQQVTHNTTWLDAFAGGLRNLAVDADGVLHGWGDDSYGELGLGQSGFFTVPIQTDTGTETQPLAQSLVGVSIQAAATTEWVKVVAGPKHTMGLKSDGTLWGWGNNKWFALGLGDEVTRFYPEQVLSVLPWVDFAVGGDQWGGFTLAIRSDGTLWVWGDNGYGQLGVGDWKDRAIPTQVGSDTDWSAVAAGDRHSLAVKNGALYAWGRNDNYQLGQGDGDYTDYNTPVRIGTDSDWSTVEAGTYHSLAIKTNGTLWAWGGGGKGQLGLGGPADYSTPQQVAPGTTWSQVSAGYEHTLGLRSDNTLWAWGANYSGQLGVGKSACEYCYVPTQVLGSSALDDWSGVSAGPFFVQARKSDGTLWSWGNDNWGQLGLGGTYGKTTPVQVGTNNDWQDVTSGGDHTMAIKMDGTLWGWGRNFEGQLGMPTWKAVPTAIPVW